MRQPPATTRKWAAARRVRHAPSAQHTAQVDEEFAVEVHRQADAVRLRSDLDALLEQSAFFETKYRMGFEEFAARLAPGADPEQESDYLAWSKLAEACRLLLTQLERSGERRIR